MSFACECCLCLLFVSVVGEFFLVLFVSVVGEFCLWVLIVSVICEFFSFVCECCL